MKIRLIYIGKTSFAYVQEGMSLYSSRVEHFTGFEQICLPDIRNSKNMPIDEIKKKEGAVILKTINISDFVCLLDVKGISHTSESFAHFLSQKTDQGQKQISFIIGGAYGFSKDVYQRADMQLSLSKMTFSHQIVRLIFMEQLYRAYTIIKGIPYHNQ